MLETVYGYSITESKAIERIIQNDHVHINHVVLGPGDALPRHGANAQVYLILVRGAVTLSLGDQEAHAYSAGSIVMVPYGTAMRLSNEGNAALEFFIVKAPGPAYYEQSL